MVTCHECFAAGYPIRRKPNLSRTLGLALQAAAAEPCDGADIHAMHKYRGEAVRIYAGCVTGGLFTLPARTYSTSRGPREHESKLSS